LNDHGNRKSNGTFKRAVHAEVNPVTAWPGQERRQGQKLDAEAMRQWSAKVDDDLEGIQNTLLKQNTVLNSLQQALFATDDKGQHNQMGLMTTAKKLCGFVAVVKWVGTMVIGVAAVTAAIKVFA
jgi:hypothetical protein